MGQANAAAVYVRYLENYESTKSNQPAAETRGAEQNLLASSLFLGGGKNVSPAFFFLFVETPQSCGDSSKNMIHIYVG